MAPRPLKVAVVGASLSDDPARHQRFAIRAHLPALKALPELFEVIATCTTTMDTATAAARQFEVPHAFDNVDRMLRELPDIDVVCVSVRPIAQHEVVMAALAAGKHVYCEHPFGATTAQAARMFKLARQNNLRTVVGHEHHYEPAMLEMLNLMRQGYVGQPINFNITFFNSGLIAPQAQPRPWLYQADMGGHAAWRTGHSLERITSVLGDIDSICADMKVHAPPRATGALPEVTQTNNLNFLLRTGGGAMGSLQVCLTAWFGAGWSFQIYGSEGMLMLREENLGRKSTVKGDPKSGHSSLYGARMGQPKMAAIMPAPQHHLVSGIDEVSTTFPVAQMWHALAMAINSGTECAPNFRDELKIHCVWDAAERSMQSRAWTTVDYGVLPERAPG